MSTATAGRVGPTQITSATQALATADRFADSLRDTVIERDRTGALPSGELARYDASGLLAITIPSVDGGPDLDMATLTETVCRIAAVDPAIAQGSRDTS